MHPQKFKTLKNRMMNFVNEYEEVYRTCKKAYFDSVLLINAGLLMVDNKDSQRTLGTLKNLLTSLNNNISKVATSMRQERNDFFTTLKNYGMNDEQKKELQTVHRQYEAILDDIFSISELTINKMDLVAAVLAEKDLSFEKREALAKELHNEIQEFKKA